jgi:D-glycero-D-manno-heptose 1,7-bisphosphate phosphatase
MLTIFLDRDGVINRKQPENDYVKSWQEFTFLPGALEGVRILSGLAARLIVVTNQRGVARGRMREEDLLDIHERMTAAVAAAGGRIDGIYHCPHEEGACQCRKPRTGLFERAQADFPDIDFRFSLIVGDSVSDLLPGAKLGCRMALIASDERRARVLGQAAREGIRVEISAASLLELSHILAAGTR